jgi:putative transposase
MGATDNGLLVTQYYGCWVVELYHGSRTHLSLEKDAPTPRRVQTIAEGDVVEFPEVGGLHHRYERRAA